MQPKAFVVTSNFQHKLEVHLKLASRMRLAFSVLLIGPLDPETHGERQIRVSRLTSGRRQLTLPCRNLLEEDLLK